MKLFSFYIFICYLFAFLYH